MASQVESTSRRGLTLLELVVAIAIGGITLLSARQLILVSSSAVRMQQRQILLQETNSNGEDLLRDLLHSAELPKRDDPGVSWPLSGDSVELRVKALCDVAGGWKEQCIMTLRVIPRPSCDTPADSMLEGTLVALAYASASVQPTRVRLPGDTYAIIYLESALQGGVWRHEWSRDAPPPPAVALVSCSDTTLFRVGMFRV